MSDLAVHKARADFADVVNRAAYRGERTTLTRRGKVVAAVVPAEDLELLERLEDEIDLAEAREVLEKVDRGEEDTVALEDVLKQLSI